MNIKPLKGVFEIEKIWNNGNKWIQKKKTWLSGQDAINNQIYKFYNIIYQKVKFDCFLWNTTQVNLSIEYMKIDHFLCYKYGFPVSSV